MNVFDFADADSTSLNVSSWWNMREYVLERLQAAEVVIWEAENRKYPDSWDLAMSIEEYRRNYG